SGREHARDGRLLDHLAIVAAMQSIEHVADHASLLDELPQISAGALFARIEPQHRLFEAAGDEIILERPLVLEILLRFAARHLVERRLRGEEMTAADDVAHLAGEKGPQPRAGVP